MSKKTLIIPYIPTIIGVVTAEIYIFYMWGSNMQDSGTLISTEGIIAIVVALLGVAGGIWGQIVQFKRDAKRIDGINKNVESTNNHVGEVKADSSEMKPQLSNVNENVKKIRDEVVEKIVPSMGKLNGVDILVKAHEIEQAFKRENSPNIYDKDTLKGTIDLVYEENAKLNKQKNEHLKLIHTQKLEIARLKSQVNTLKHELDNELEQEQGMEMQF